MVPIVNTVPVILTPLVATALPDAIAAARVPYDNVAPSVSSPQTNPNARGNSVAVAASQSPPISIPLSASSPISARASGGLTLGTPTGFLAQVIGQDFSPAAQSVLAAYERLVAISQVKYKPSNAGKPAPEPTGVYARQLAQQRSVPRAPVELPAAPLPKPEAATVPAPQITLVLKPKSAEPAKKETRASLPAAVGAYQASVARNAAIKAPAPPTEPVAAEKSIDEAKPTA